MVVEHTIPLTTKVIVGGCVFALQTLGVDAGPIVFAIVGASIGMSFAAPTTRVIAIVHFVAVVLACSLLGTWFAQRYFGDGLTDRNACSCVLALVFHPLLNAAVTRLPKVIDGVMRKLGLLQDGERRE